MTDETKSIEELLRTLDAARANGPIAGTDLHTLDRQTIDDLLRHLDAYRRISSAVRVMCGLPVEAATRSITPFDLMAPKVPS